MTASRVLRRASIDAATTPPAPVVTGFSLLVLVVLLGACTGTSPQPTAPARSSQGDTADPAPADATEARAEPGARLLPAARAYVEAVNAGDLDALVAAFDEDGVVIDVTREIRGREAIREWADAEVIGGSLRVDGITPVDAATQRVRVHWAPAGSTGWAADYTFTVRGDKVVVADLQYA